MMDNSNRVTLICNGLEFSGWLSVRIESSLQSLCRAAQVSATRQVGESDLTASINVGDAASVRIGEDTVITGWITSKNTEYSATSVSVSITIKSKTVDLDECSIPVDKPHQWGTAVKLNQLVQQLAGLYGIGCVFAQDNGNCTFQLDMNASVSDAIVKLLKDKSLLVSDDAEGRLVIAKAGGAGHAASGLQTGVNVLSSSRQQDASAIFRTYAVLGQSTNPDSNVSGCNSLKGTATNTAVRNRTKVWVESGNRTQKDLNARAQNLMFNAIGNADKLSYEVQGWRQSDGSLWRVNQLVRIDDDYFNIHQDLLISRVSMSIGSGGTTAELDVIAPDAFLVTDLPDAEKTQGKTAKGKSTKSTDKGYTFLAKKGSGVIK